MDFDNEPSAITAKVIFITFTRILHILGLFTANLARSALGKTMPAVSSVARGLYTFYQ